MLTNAELFSILKEINIKLDKLIDLENRVVNLSTEVRLPEDNNSLGKELARLNTCFGYSA